MTKTPQVINNWKPETASLLRRLIAAGCTLLKCNNGDGPDFPFTGKFVPFVAELIACDEASLWVRTPTRDRAWIYLVLGNEPGELVCDYTVDPTLDKVTEAHYEEWSKRKQPVLFV